MAELTPWERAIALREAQDDVAKFRAISQADERRKRVAGAKAQREVNDRGMSFVDKLDDVGRSLSTGIGRGVVSTPGAFADIVSLGEHARDRMDAWWGGRPLEEVQGENRARREQTNILTPSRLEAAGGQAMIDYARQAGVPGLDHEAQTSWGEGAEGLGEFAGGAAVGGPRGVLSRVIRQGVAPGLAVTAAEAAGVDNPLLLAAIGGTTGAAAGGNRSAEDIMRARMRDVTPAQLHAAERIFTDANAQGMRVSRANALDFVTQGGTSLSDLQRVIEGGGGMRQFYQGANQGSVAGAEAAAQIPSAVQGTPGIPDNPSTIGPRAAKVMERHLDDTNKRLNAQVGPQYDAFQDQPVPPQMVQAAMANPLFARQHEDLFGRVDPQTGQRDPGNPELAHLTQGLDPHSAGAYDLVRQRLERVEKNKVGATNTDPDSQAATGYGIAGQLGQEGASEASRQIQPAATIGSKSPLEVVQQERAILGAKEYDPLYQGPEGRISRSNGTGSAQDAMFPARPGPGESKEVGRAMRTLTQQDPQLAHDFARHYMGTKLASAAQSTQAGNTYYAPTKLWQSIAGNPEQGRAFEAVLSELPGGPQRVRAWQTFVEIAQAMGHRQRIGSNTAFNQADFETMKKGGASEAIAKTLAGGGLKFPEKVWDFFERARMGHNVDEITELFTDPARAADFARLARAPTRSAQLTAQLARMINSLPVGRPVQKGAMQSDLNPINEDD
jgi:hypothetical protein